MFNQWLREAWEEMLMGGFGMTSYFWNDAQVGRGRSTGSGEARNREVEVWTGGKVLEFAAWRKGE